MEIKKFLNSRNLRRLNQIFFFILMVYITYKYILSVYTGSPRPNAIDAFCPIAGTYDIIMKIRTGYTDPYHPAAMSIILSSIFLTLILGKAFCSNICIVGSFLDFLTYIRNKFNIFKKIDELGEKIKNFRFYFVIDYILRSFKFILLGWILYLVLSIPAQFMVAMNQAINMGADLDLLKFWIDVFHFQAKLGALIILLLVILDIIIPRFWCKYLCPLGAFYGIFNLFSLTRLRRYISLCTNCKLCKDCKIGLKPFNMKEYNNTECIFCLECKESCKPKAIKLEILGREIPSLIYPILVTLLFFAFIYAFKKFGLWNSQITKDMWARLILNKGFKVKWAINYLQKIPIKPNF